MNSFMSSIKSAAASAVSGGDDDKNTNPDQTSNSDLVSSAKLVAEAAQSAASNQSDKIDKPKVAGATADLLDAAKKYGKFDDTQGAGQYLKQANDYLHQYEKSGSPAAPPAAEEKKADAPPAAEEEEKKVDAPPPVEEKKEEEKKKEESGSEFGAADAFKAAGSFFK